MSSGKVHIKVIIRYFQLRGFKSLISLNQNIDNAFNCCTVLKNNYGS